MPIPSVPEMFSSLAHDRAVRSRRLTVEECLSGVGSFAGAR
jgi:hypothetical protein